jgi:hypothetical protein
MFEIDSSKVRFKGINNNNNNNNNNNSNTNSEGKKTNKHNCVVESQHNSCRPNLYSGRDSSDGQWHRTFN